MVVILSEIVVNVRYFQTAADIFESLILVKLRKVCMPEIPAYSYVAAGVLVNNAAYILVV